MSKEIVAQAKKALKKKVSKKKANLVVSADKPKRVATIFVPDEQVLTDLKLEIFKLTSRIDRIVAAASKAKPITKDM